MKIKITHPVPEKDLQAGFEYDLPAKEAKELIKQGFAFEVVENKAGKEVEYDAR